MYELHFLKGNTYYIDGPTNIGVYKLNDNDCILIDCGTVDEGPIIEKILNDNNLILKYIVNTHNHVDHSGSNVYLSKKTNCKVINTTIEKAFMLDDPLDVGFLYGGQPLNEFRKYFLNISGQIPIYTLEELPEGLEVFKLPGHHYDMIGIKTSDDVYFVADSLCSKEIIDKQHILLIYDVDGYLKSLDLVESFNGNIIVPSHSEVTDNIIDIIEYNRNKVYEVKNLILDIIKEEQTLEDIIAKIFEHYNLRITHNKYLIISTTIRSYLSYLSNNSIIKTHFNNNKLYYVKE